MGAPPMRRRVRVEERVRATGRARRGTRARKPPIVVALVAEDSHLG